jgi:hypothetical protein
MKTVIQFSTKKVNYQKNLNLMKAIHQSKIGISTLFLLFFSFIACQKEISGEDTPSAISKKPSVSKDIPATDIISVEDTDRPSVLQATPRAELADIEDVPVVTAGVISNCAGTEDQKIYCALIFRFLNSIKPGQRIGIADNLNTTTRGTNLTSCYVYGGQNVCGYVGKENLHPLYIPENGNYRLQMTPKNPNRDYDVFVYKLSVLNTVIIRTLVAHSVFPQGKTETLHITQEGVYDIVVDEYPNRNGQVGQGDGNYVLSLSPNTVIKTAATYNENTDNVTYQFSRNDLRPTINMIGWLFRKKQGNAWLNLGMYEASSNFSFSCNNCDYLVAPIYENIFTGVRTEGTATVIRP